MTDEAVSRRRENAAFFLRILAFGLIFTLISCAVLYVLTPKYDYGPGSMMNLPLQPRNTIEVRGLDDDRDRLILLVIPPRTDPGDAHATMMTAAQSGNAGTVDGLLMISPRDRATRTQASNAQERWESEGGTTTSPRSQRALA